MPINKLLQTIYGKLSSDEVFVIAQLYFCWYTQLTLLQKNPAKSGLYLLIGNKAHAFHGHLMTALPY